MLQTLSLLKNLNSQNAIKKVLSGFCNSAFNSCSIFGQTINNFGFLFFLCDLYFINLFLLAGIFDYFIKNILKTIVVFTKCVKNMQTSCAGQRSELRCEGQVGSPSGFKLFSFRNLWNHFAFKISCQNVPETIKQDKKNKKSGHKKTKRDGFYLNSRFIHEYYS